MTWPPKKEVMKANQLAKEYDVDPSNRAIADCENCATFRAKLEEYFTAAEFERVQELIDKPPEFFKRLGEVVAGRTKSLASMNAKLDREKLARVYRRTVVGADIDGPVEEYWLTRADAIISYFKE
jgi:rhamnose utilization protein RhaD (predicted bifunctional aldolase and dehydrogenase)